MCVVVHYVWLHFMYISKIAFVLTRDADHLTALCLSARVTDTAPIFFGLIRTKNKKKKALRKFKTLLLLVCRLTRLIYRPDHWAVVQHSWMAINQNWESVQTPSVWPFWPELNLKAKWIIGSITSSNRFIWIQEAIYFTRLAVHLLKFQTLRALRVLFKS